MIARPADVMASAQHRPPVWAAGAGGLPALVSTHCRHWPRQRIVRRAERHRTQYTEPQRARQNEKTRNS